MCTGKQASLFTSNATPILLTGSNMTSNLNLTFKKFECSWFSWMYIIPTIFNDFREQLLSLDYAQVNLPTKQCTYLPSISAPKQWLAHLVEVDRQQRSIFTEGSTLAGKVVVIPYWPAGPRGWYHLSLSSPTINKNPRFKLPIQAGAH